MLTVICEREIITIRTRDLEIVKRCLFKSISALCTAAVFLLNEIPTTEFHNLLIYKVRYCVASKFFGIDIYKGHFK